jgi:multidrug efflux pump
VIVGGMSLGTTLTVFVVPTMYMLFARARVPGANKAQAREAAPGAHEGELVAK